MDAGAAVVCMCVTAWALFVSTNNNVVQSFDLQTFRPIPKSRSEPSTMALLVSIIRFAYRNDHFLTGGSWLLRQNRVERHDSLHVL